MRKIPLKGVFTTGFRCNRALNDRFLKKRYKVACSFTLSKAPEFVCNNLFATPIKVLDAPGVYDDFYSQYLSWSKLGLFVCLDTSLYLYNGDVSELLSGDSRLTCVTSNSNFACVGDSKGFVHCFDESGQFVQRLGCFSKNIQTGTSTCVLNSGNTPINDWVDTRNDNNTCLAINEDAPSDNQNIERDDHLSNLSNENIPNLQYNTGLDLYNDHSRSQPVIINDNTFFNLSPINSTHLNTVHNFENSLVQDINLGSTHNNTNTNYANTIYTHHNTDLNNSFAIPFGRVGALAINGNTIACGHKDGHLIIYDIRTNQIVKILQPHNSEITSVAFSQKGTVIATGSNDNTLKITDLRTKSTQKILEAKAAIKGLAYDPDRPSHIAIGTGSNDRTLRIMNTESLTQTIKDAGSQVCALAFVPNRREIVTAHGFSNNDVCLWQASLRRKSSFGKHESRVLGMAISVDGNQVASIGADENLKIWELSREGISSREFTQGEVLRRDSLQLR